MSQENSENFLKKRNSPSLPNDCENDENDAPWGLPVRRVHTANLGFDSVELFPFAKRLSHEVRFEDCHKIHFFELCNQVIAGEGNGVQGWIQRAELPRVSDLVELKRSVEERLKKQNENLDQSCRLCYFLYCFEYFIDLGTEMLRSMRNILKLQPLGGVKSEFTEETVSLRLLIDRLHKMWPDKSIPYYGKAIYSKQEILLDYIHKNIQNDSKSRIEALITSFLQDTFIMLSDTGFSAQSRQLMRKLFEMTLNINSEMELELTSVGELIFSRFEVFYEINKSHSQRSWGVIVDSITSYFSKNYRSQIGKYYSTSQKIQTLLIASENSADLLTKASSLSLGRISIENLVHSGDINEVLDLLDFISKEYCRLPFHVFIAQMIQKNKELPKDRIEIIGTAISDKIGDECNEDEFWPIAGSSDFKIPKGVATDNDLYIPEIINRLLNPFLTVPAFTLCSPLLTFFNWLPSNKHPIFLSSLYSSPLFSSLSSSLDISRRLFWENKQGGALIAFLFIFFGLSPQSSPFRVRFSDEEPFCNYLQLAALEGKGQKNPLDEIADIFTATSTNSWEEGQHFTKLVQCGCGFLYWIGDCGRALTVGKCPQCKEVIGGRNHSLLKKDNAEINKDRFFGDIYKDRLDTILRKYEKRGNYGGEIYPDPAIFTRLRYIQSYDSFVFIDIINTARYLFQWIFEGEHARNALSKFLNLEDPEPYLTSLLMSYISPTSPFHICALSYLLLDLEFNEQSCSSSLEYERFLDQHYSLNYKRSLKASKMQFFANNEIKSDKQLLRRLVDDAMLNDEKKEKRIDVWALRALTIPHELSRNDVIEIFERVAPGDIVLRKIWEFEDILLGIKEWLESHVTLCQYIFTRYQHKLRYEVACRVSIEELTLHYQNEFEESDQRKHNFLVEFAGDSDFLIMFNRLKATWDQIMKSRELHPDLLDFRYLCHSQELPATRIEEIFNPKTSRLIYFIANTTKPECLFMCSSLSTLSTITSHFSLEFSDGSRSVCPSRALPHYREFSGVVSLNVAHLGRPLSALLVPYLPSPPASIAKMILLKILKSSNIYFFKKKDFVFFENFNGNELLGWAVWKMEKWGRPLPPNLTAHYNTLATSITPCQNLWHAAVRVVVNYWAWEQEGHRKREVGQMDAKEALGYVGCEVDILPEGLKVKDLPRILLLIEQMYGII